jgi:hypothetical protein
MYAVRAAGIGRARVSPGMRHGSTGGVGVPKSVPVSTEPLHAGQSSAISPTAGSCLPGLFSVTLSGTSPAADCGWSGFPKPRVARSIHPTSPTIPSECCPHCRQASSALSCAAIYSFAPNRPFSLQDTQVRSPVPFARSGYYQFQEA